MEELSVASEWMSLGLALRPQRPNVWICPVRSSPGRPSGGRRCAPSITPSRLAETGPFYCPAAHGVYLNTDFFDALSRAYSLGPFAAGYVTAHEVAHHVQQLLGLHARVAAASAQDRAGENGRSVRVELQADCYAGVWLHAVANAGELSRADVTDILTAAAVVGDDYQRNRAGAELAPETWTHGSSEQRVHWVSVGRTGLPGRCDTFSAG